jgi:phospholipid/cholesterol/gamma-HCH transport system substrate-binding protein
MILYAKYSNIQGLSISNPVIINGFQVGTVSDIHPDRDMKNLLVTIELKEEIQIPSNSLGVIIPNPLGDTKIEIRLGDNNQNLKVKKSF